MDDLHVFAPQPSAVWISPARVSKDFIGGGRSVDYSVRSDFMLTQTLALSAYTQYEHWTFPTLSTVPQSNVTGSVQLTFSPNWHLRK